MHVHIHIIYSIIYDRDHLDITKKKYIILVSYSQQLTVVPDIVSRYQLNFAISSQSLNQEQYIVILSRSVSVIDLSLSVLALLHCLQLVFLTARDLYRVVTLAFI